MSDYQDRVAPATGFEKRLRTFGFAEQLALVIGLPAAALVGLQFFVQMLVTLITGTKSFTPLPVFHYIGLWGAADPAARYGVDGAGALHWALIVFIAVVIVAVVFLFVRAASKRRKDPQRRPGLATREQVLEELGEEQLLTERAPVLRPAVPASKLRAMDVGYRVGMFRGIECFLRVEDPMIVIGPSRAGKGWNLVLPWIMDAPGAVVTTTSKLDNAQMTMQARERAGSKVWIFAPGIPSGKDFGHVLKWDPVAGCVHEETLIRRINGLIPADAFSGSTTNGGHWDTLGKQLATALFHAAACGGRTVDDIWGWVASPRAAEEAVRLIREHPEGLTEHATRLETVINMPPEQRAPQWGVLPTVLAFLDSRSARDWMKVGQDDAEFNFAEFILHKGTVYLIGDKKTSASYLRILDGFLSEVDYVSKAIAAGSPGGRLDPPLTYLLDEAGNFEYQGMYELITAGGGVGRIGVAVFQSKSQLQQYGGQEGADTLWDAATAKIVLPGGGDPRALEDMSKLIGDTLVEREAHSKTLNGPAQMQLSEEKRAIFDGSEIRTLEKGMAFVFYRNLPPLVPKTRPFHEHPRFAECQKDAKNLEQHLRDTSEYGDAIAKMQAGYRA